MKTCYIHADCGGMPPLEKTADYAYVGSCNWAIPAEQLGLAEESIIRLFDDYDHLNTGTHTGAAETIVFILPRFCSQRLFAAIKVFNALNEITSVKVCVICETPLHAFLRKFANEHIQFHSYESPVCERVIRSGIILTYGSGAFHFIRRNLPVVIAGPYGIGGLVTEENLETFVSYNFMGRPGGTATEKLPSQVLSEEILSAELEERTLKQLAAFSKMFQCIPLSNINEATCNCIIFDFTNDPHKIPFVCSNVEFTHRGGDIYITRKTLNDTLAVTNTSEFGFFKLINGERDFASLFKSSGMKQDEFSDLVQGLIQSRIINIRNAIFQRQ